MHYSKSVIYVGSHYKALCGEIMESKKSNSALDKTTCSKCLKLLLIRENDKLNKIAERIVLLEKENSLMSFVEETPPVPILPLSKPYFL